MKVLAVDTSSSVAAVAAMEDQKLLGEFLINNGKTHSQKLMPLIDQLLSSLELKPADIDLFAASSGPGSFTGLRIGIMTVKAMAYAAKKPVVSVPTLDALAYNIPDGGSFICPIMDARNNQVYTAVYKYENQLPVNQTGYLGLHVSELARMLEGMNGNVIFNGDAVLLHRDFLKIELGERCSFAQPSLMLQRASSVAELAIYKALKGETESSFDMVPFYLRPSQAEREFDRKQARCPME